MRPTAHRSLARRLSLSVGLSSAVLSLVVLGLVAGMYIQRSAAHMEEHVRRSAAFLADALEYPLWNLDLESVRTIGRAVGQDHVVGLVEVTGAHNETLFRYQSHDTIVISNRAQVEHDGQVIGWVLVGLNDLERQTTLWPVVLTGAGLAGLIILLQYLLHAWYVRPLLGRPFASLDRLVSAYSAGDFTPAPPEAPYAEFAPLFALLGDMGATIRRQVDDLRASEERLSLALDAANDGMWDWDVATGTTHFSPRYFTMLGYEPGEFAPAHDSFQDLLHPEDLERVDEALIAALGGQPYEIEFRLRDKSGQWRWVLSRGRVVERDDAGHARRMVGTHVDITARKELELRLAASEQRYRTLFEVAQDSILVVQDGRVVDCNHSAEALLGRHRQDIMGRFPAEMSPPRQPDGRDSYEGQDQVHAATASGRKLLFDWTFARPDGSLVWVEVSLQSIGGENPNLLVGMIRDVTERRRAEEKLRRSEEKFSRLFRLSPDHVALNDLETGRFVEVNESFLRFHNRTREEVIGHTVFELGIYVDPDKRKELVEAMRVHGRVDNFEFEVRRGDGAVRNGSMSAQMVEIAGRTLMMSILRDTTDIKRMQEVMVQTEKMISVGGIAAGVAHEINNPLGIVLQATHNLIRRTDPGLARNQEAAQAIGLDLGLMHRYMQARKLDVFLEDIRSAAVRAATIIRHMLDFSRRSESTRRACGLPDIVRKAVGLAQSDYDLKKSYDFKQIKIVLETGTNLPPVTCTETEIEQVILNLLRNAAQAMAAAEPPVAEPRIAVRLSALPGAVRIEVEDNGPGIPPEIQRRIFEPFFTTKAPGEGTGLGLSVSYFIVTKGHEGKMGVESAPGKGTIFTIDLPTEARK